MTFSDTFKNNTRVFSFEFFPPKKEKDLPATKDMIRRMSNLEPHFMTVTYGAGGGTREWTQELVSYIVNELKCPAAAHLTCVQHTVDEIDKMLDALAAVGVKDIVALRGDPSNTQGLQGPKFPGFTCARDLVRHIKARGDFNIAVAGYPETHEDAASPQADLAYLKEKVDMGADIIITQVFFDAKIYFSFVNRARNAGILVPIVPGLLPIANLKQVETFAAKCGASIPPKLHADLQAIADNSASLRAYGTSYAVRLCEELLAGGAPGIHFYTLNKSVQVEEVLKVIKGALP